MRDAITDFRAALAAAGLGAPREIIPDGAIHRYHVQGDRSGTRNGWYALHLLDGRPAGGFGSWKTGESHTWTAGGEALTPLERERHRRMVAESRRQRDAETARRQAHAAERAAERWEQARPADPRHPYLTAKQVRPHGIRQRGDLLMVPVEVDGRLSSIQFISPDGSKLFLVGGRIAGGCYRIEGEADRPELLIAEGFATAASLREETGAACYVAFNAGNLLAVARYVRRLHPAGAIIICGDDDQWTPGNPGRSKAREAAIAIRGKILMPDWSGLDLASRPTDFNDWRRLSRGAGRVTA
jgi:putative DNA primase/helicase